MNTNIEIDDTVRFIGRKARWVVQDIKGNDVEVIGMWRLNRNTQRIIIRTVDMSRIELVRKGNAEKDSLAKLDREMAAARGVTVEAYRAEIQASYERNKVAAAARETAERKAAEAARIAAAERAAREAAEAAEAAELAAIEAARKAAEDARWTEAYEARVTANNGDMIAALLDMIPTV